MVGVNDVLTASHVVYSRDHGGAAVATQIIPAYSNGSANPYGSYAGGAIHYNAIDDSGGMISSSDMPKDFAVIALKTTLGLQTGFFGFDPSFTSGAANLAAYPAAQNGHMTYSAANTSLQYLSDGSNYVDISNFYVAPGSSGGAVYEMVNGKPYVVGVVSTANWAAPIVNGPIASAYNDVVNYINQDHQYVAQSLPTLNFSNQTVQIGQGVTKTLTFQLNETFSVPIADDVTVSTKNGSALSGVDFDAFNGHLTIGANAISTGFNLNLHPNWGAHQGASHLDFYLDFSNPQAAVFTNSYSSAEATISMVNGSGPSQMVAYGQTTHIFAQQSANYTILQNQSSLSITDKAGVEGSFTFSIVDRLQFSDKSLSFDMSGDVAKSYRLYNAAYSHVPDMQGLGYWSAQLDKGTSLTDVAGFFIYCSNLNGMNTKQFVDTLYNNVFNRQADSSGEAYWMNTIDSGHMSRAGLLMVFSEWQQGQDVLLSTMHQGMSYIPWLG